MVFTGIQKMSLTSDSAILQWPEFLDDKDSVAHFSVALTLVSLITAGHREGLRKSERLSRVSIAPSPFPAGRAQNRVLPGGAGRRAPRFSQLCCLLLAWSSMSFRELTGCQGGAGLQTSFIMSPTGSFEPLACLTRELPKIRLGRGLGWEGWCLLRSSISRMSAEGGGERSFVCLCVYVCVIEFKWNG